MMWRAGAGEHTSPRTRTSGEAEGTPARARPASPREEAQLGRTLPRAAGGKLPDSPPPRSFARTPARPVTTATPSPRPHSPSPPAPPRRGRTPSRHRERALKPQPRAGSSSRPPRRRAPAQAPPPHFLPLRPPGRLSPHPCDGQAVSPNPRAVPGGAAACGALAPPCGWRRIARV